MRFRRTRLIAPLEAAKDTVLLEQRPCRGPLDLDHVRLLDIRSWRDGVEI